MDHSWSTWILEAEVSSLAGFEQARSHPGRSAYKTNKQKSCSVFFTGMPLTVLMTMGTTNSVNSLF